MELGVAPQLYHQLTPGERAAKSAGSARSYATPRLGLFAVGVTGGVDGVVLPGPPPDAGGVVVPLPAEPPEPLDPAELPAPLEPPAPVVPPDPVETPFPPAPVAPSVPPAAGGVVLPDSSPEVGLVPDATD